MKNTTLKKLSLTLLAATLAGTALAGTPLMAPPWQHPAAQPVVPYRAEATTPFYSNLVNDPSTSLMYDISNGFLVLGPTNCFDGVSTQWLAYPFYASRAGAPRSITVGVTLDADICSNGSNKFTVALYSDNNGPDTALTTATATAAPTPGGLDTVTLRRAPSLVAGAKYYVVCMTSGTAQSPFTGVWWESNYGTFYVNFNDGSGWQFAANGNPGAFSVQ